MVQFNVRQNDIFIFTYMEIMDIEINEWNMIDKHETIPIFQLFQKIEMGKFDDNSRKRLYTLRCHYNTVNYSPK